VMWSPLSSIVAEATVRPFVIESSVLWMAFLRGSEIGGGFPTMAIVFACTTGLPSTTVMPTNTEGNV